MPLCESGRPDPVFGSATGYDDSIDQTVTWKYNITLTTAATPLTEALPWRLFFARVNIGGEYLKTLLDKAS